MKRLCMALFVIAPLFALRLNIAEPVKKEVPERSIVVIIPSYNNEEVLEKNLRSIFEQKYDNYRVLYTNDASTDRTGELVEAYVKEHGLKDRITVFHNEKNRGSFYNIYQMVHRCKKSDIICIVDGDDYLIHDHVLDLVNRTYANEQVWVAWFSGVQPNDWEARSWAIATRTLQKGLHRAEKGSFFLYMRTFYAGLYHSVPLQCWEFQGEFPSICQDVLLMYYLLDRAREHAFHVRHRVYYYNTDNPLSDVRNKKREQFVTSRLMKRAKPIPRFHSRSDFLEE